MMLLQSTLVLVLLFVIEGAILCVIRPVAQASVAFSGKYLSPKPSLAE
jgi:hypothetical protein